MTIAITEKDGDPGKLAVSGSLTIYNAIAVKTTLLASLEKSGALEIDLSGVDEIDTAGVQLLVLTKREGVAAGKTVRLVQHSPAVLEVFDRYNLTSYFADLTATVSS